MGLFERTKHLDRLAREIADENLRRLGGAPARLDDAETRRQLLELERLLREYRLNLEEAEARRHLAGARLDAAREKAQVWRSNVELAHARAREDLAGQALARALVYERERETAAGECEQQQAALARLRGEISGVERRITVLRSLRSGARPSASTPAPSSSGPPTRKLARPSRDPLEDAFDRLRAEG